MSSCALRVGVDLPDPDDVSQKRNYRAHKYGKVRQPADTEAESVHVFVHERKRLEPAVQQGIRE